MIAILRFCYGAAGLVCKKMDLAFEQFVINWAIS
jgi:hypothetical protein